jgi:large subunit ribosomal protein L9
MKILLLKDVYKLGRAGEVKKVAAGYGRNYLIPQGLAVLATPGALQQAEYIREKAAAQRDALNKEMSGIAEKMVGLVLTFPAKASETDKLYGSITTHMIAETLSEKTGIEIFRRQIDSQPLRMLGEHKVPVRLTVDLIPAITVIVYREGESPEAMLAELSSRASETPAETSEMDSLSEAVESETEVVEYFAEEETETFTETTSDVDESEAGEELESETLEE